MKNVIIFLIVIFPLNSIIGQSFEKIESTIWIYEFEDNVNDSIIFNSDSTYIQYSAEIDEHYFGNYKIKNDTLFLFQKSEEYENQLLDCSKNINEKSLQKYILTNSDKLKIVFSKSDNSISQKFGDKYLFKKVKLKKGF